jgi:RimJ/RimL family protein N-acetyltransferase
MTTPTDRIIETERLILRPPIADDFGGYCAFHGDSETMRYLGGISSPGEVWRRMRVAAGSWALDGFSFFSVIEKSSGKWIGRVGPIKPHQWPAPEIAWGLLSSQWGKGYAKEAATGAIEFAFAVLEWGSVSHMIDPENLRSAALATALGSQNKGPTSLPDPFSGLRADIWSQSNDEWRSRNART